MRSLPADLRYGLRMMLRSPGFTSVAVLSLGLGIGANTAIFSLVNAILLRPLAADDPASLVAVYTSDFSGPRYGTSSYPDYRDFAASSHDVTAGMAAYAPFQASMRERERSDVVFGEMVSGNYFDLRGVPAAAGRTFTPEQDKEGAQPVVVLSHRFWTSRFQADPSVIGRTIRLNGVALTVLGVAPPDFASVQRGLDVGFWAPAVLDSQLRPGSSASMNAAHEAGCCSDA